MFNSLTIQERLSDAASEERSSCCVTPSMDMDWELEPIPNGPIWEPIPNLPSPALRETPEPRWTDNPFGYFGAPFSFYLNPQGHLLVRAMEGANVKSYHRLLPEIHDVANVLHSSLPQVLRWGKHLMGNGDVAPNEGQHKEDVSWKRITDGTWIKTKQGRFPQKRMALIDVINSMSNPACYAIGNEDVRIGVLAPVRHLRIDIDLDLVFALRDIQALKQEIEFCHEVLTAFGLRCHVMATGNRGIQIIASIPEMERSLASVVVHSVRIVLQHCAGVRRWRAKDFQSNLEGLMRLPLGRHAWSGSLAVMLHRDNSVMSPSAQIAEVKMAFARTPALDREWAGEIRDWLYLKVEPDCVIKEEMFRRLVSDCPSNELVRAFREACNAWNVEEWTDASQFSFSSGLQHDHDFKMSAVESLPPDNSIYEDELDTHIIVCDRHAGQPSHRISPFVKARAQKVLNEGFRAGESFLYYTNRTVGGSRGKDAIGAAIIVNDGDREKARLLLIEQAERTDTRPESHERDVKDRIDYINGNIHKNDSYEYACEHALADHRSIEVEVSSKHQRIAQCIAARLPELRRACTCRTKVFQPNALEVIEQAAAVMIAMIGKTDTGTVAVSLRSLCSELEDRVPVTPTAMQLSRNLEWITEGSDRCLIPIFRICGGRATIYDSITYGYGEDFAEIESESRQNT